MFPNGGPRQSNSGYQIPKRQQGFFPNAPIGTNYNPNNYYGNDEPHNRPMFERRPQPINPRSIYDQIIRGGNLSRDRNNAEGWNNASPWNNAGGNPQKRRWNGGGGPVAKMPTMRDAKNAATKKLTFPHLSDPTLPKELKALYQPLFCKLCSVQLSSNQTAKLHYSSKNHEKKVRLWLVEYAERTGEPLHKLASTPRPKDNTKDPKFYHCDLCDVALTGRLHAESHYMGKAHQRALMGEAPAGKGHYNEEGQFVRNKPMKADPTGRHGIGLDFMSPEEQQLVAEPDQKKKQPEPKQKKEIVQIPCELCHITVTSEMLLISHYKGQKHQRKMKLTGSTIGSECSVQAEESEPDSSAHAPNDLSPFKTPSGDYYCNKCNNSMNSEIQFKQHLASKKHKKNLNGSADVKKE